MKKSLILIFKGMRKKIRIAEIIYQPDQSTDVNDPWQSVSSYASKVKGRTAIRVLNKFKQLKKRSYWGNHFWARGYCVDTIGLDAEMVKKYVKYQEAQERRSEQPKFF